MADAHDDIVTMFTYVRSDRSHAVDFIGRADTAEAFVQLCEQLHHVPKIVFSLKLTREQGRRIVAASRSVPTSLTEASNTLSRCPAHPTS